MQHIPIFHTISNTVNYIISSYKEILRTTALFITLNFIVVLLVPSMVEKFYDMENQSISSIGALTLLKLILNIILLVVTIRTIVNLHRIFIDQSNKITVTDIFGFGKRDLKYLFKAFLLNGLIWLFVGSSFYLFILFLKWGAFEFPQLTRYEEYIPYVIVFILISIFLPIVSRFVLVLPSIAVDMELSFTKSWNLTRGNSIRLSILLMLIPFTVFVVFTLLPIINSFVYGTIVILLWFITLIFEIGILSLSYSYLANKQEKFP